jgi:dynein light intermediate chain 2, cytosolic
MLIVFFFCRIAFGNDSWEKIGVTPSNSERIGITYNAEIPQIGATLVQQQDDPGKDPGFSESIIDSMRAQKDEELVRLLKEYEIRGKFETLLPT